MLASLLPQTRSVETQAADVCGRAKDNQTLATKARLGADGSPCALASLATAMRLSVQIAPTAAVKQQSTSKAARLIVRVCRHNQEPRHLSSLSMTSKCNQKQPCFWVGARCRTQEFRAEGPLGFRS